MRKSVKRITGVISLIVIIVALAYATLNVDNVKHAFGIGRIACAEDVLEETKIQSELPSDTAIEIEWYRSRLDTEEKIALYDAMKAAIASVSMGVEVPNMPEEDVLECYWAVVYDHPEFFWLGREYVFYTAPDGTYTGFDFKYLMTDRDEIQTKMRDIEAAADAIISGSYVDNISLKMEFIYKWVGGSTTYEEGEHDQTMLGVFVDHKAVCAGYVQATQYLWLRAGIPCVRISGHYMHSDGTISDENHTWLCAVPTNRMFFYDVTWDDVNNASSMEKYYKVDQEEFYKTHIAESSKSPREDSAREVVEMAVNSSTGMHLAMSLKNDDDYE